MQAVERRLDAVGAGEIAVPNLVAPFRNGRNSAAVELLEGEGMIHDVAVDDGNQFGFREPRVRRGRGTLYPGPTFRDVWHGLKVWLCV